LTTIEPSAWSSAETKPGPEAVNLNAETVIGGGAGGGAGVVSTGGAEALGAGGGVVSAGGGVVSTGADALGALSAVLGGGLSPPPHASKRAAAQGASVRRRFRMAREPSSLPFS
jgi:hypothetical protein